MRALRLFALLLLLGSCSSGLPEAPRELTLDYSGRAVLNLPLPQQTVWALQPSGLLVNRAEGVGPATLRFTAPLEQVADSPQQIFNLRWRGDLQGDLRVVWPLVHVSGQVVESAAISATLPSAQLPRAEKGTVPQRVLVRYARAAAAPQGLPAAGDEKLRIIASTDPEKLAAKLAEDPNVLWAEPDGLVHALGEPGDEYYPLEWHLRKTGARWAYLANFNQPVTVAVIDSGVRYDHPDLAGRLWGPADGAYDFVNNDDDPTDEGDNHNPRLGSHGTHVSGIIAARSGENALPASCYDAHGNPVCSKSGVVGAAWAANVKVLPLRVLDENGNGSFSAVAAAIRYAAGLSVTWGDVTLSNPHPAKIINLSLGASMRSQALCEAVAAASDAGVLVVAAAGNNGGGAYFYPASCPGAISVAATDNSNGEPKPTWYSQHNDRVDISAPGGDSRQDADGDGHPDGILSTTWNFERNMPNYGYYMGTSQAAPQVSAALALLLASGEDAASAWRILKETSTDLGEPGYDVHYGYGFVNLPAALALTLPAGKYRVHFGGPLERWLSTDADGNFSTYLPSAEYSLTACRDDSANGFCDGDEPAFHTKVTAPPQDYFSLGSLLLRRP